MNRGIYATATGMWAAQSKMDVIANNLANAATTGYKRDGLAFAERYERELRANGGLGASLGTLGSGAIQRSQFTHFGVGALSATSNPLDLAIPQDKGLFAVQTPQGIRYTRDGAFALNTDRELVNKLGYPVLDESGRPITLPTGTPQIQDDGTVRVGDREAGKIGIFDGTFQKSGNNLYESNDAKPLESATVKAGHLEASNVNPVEAMIEMISLNRSFELAQRSIVQQDELTQRLIQSLRDQ